LDAIEYNERRDIALTSLIALYRANGWSSADKPLELQQALLNSHSLITAWSGDQLVGLGNAISDGHLVVYYPHLVHPDYQGRGIGSEILKRLLEKYRGFHQHMLVADGKTKRFYEKLGFTRAGDTAPMWIYSGNDH
jgi:GNAT superfamily N-acetyltransferase